MLTTVLLYLGPLPPSLFFLVPDYSLPICISVLLICPKSLMWFSNVGLVHCLICLKAIQDGNGGKGQ